MGRLADGNYVDREGDLVWVENGDYHRVDGPAVIFGDGVAIRGSIWTEQNTYMSWWVRGQPYTFEDWLELVDIADEEAVMLKLEHG